MAYNGTKKEKSLDLQAQAFDLRTQGLTQHMIGKRLGISQQTVSKMLAKATREFARLHYKRVANEKFAQVARLEHIIYEAMCAWETSKNTTPKFDDDGDPMPIYYADSRFLSEARKSIVEVTKLLGIQELPPPFPQDEYIGQINIQIVGKDKKPLVERDTTTQQSDAEDNEDD